jgi:mannose-6-phosphate isomerase-like protein (cupin superfamily)
MNSLLVERPWGHFERFTLNEKSTVKLLYIKKGETLSLQYHSHRDEFWKIISGNPFIEIGEIKKNAGAGDQFETKALTHHRISAPKDDVVFLEIAFGEFDEEDNVRLEDKYNREK